MTTMDVVSLKKCLPEIVERAILYNEPITITSKSGNAVLLSESAYCALLKAVNLMDEPSYMEGYNEAKRQDRSTYEKLDLNEAW